MKTTLYLTVAVREDLRGRGAAAAVLRWDQSAAPRVIVRRMKNGGGVPGTYRALLFALWEARRVGARSLIVDAGDSDVSAQILGADPPPEGALGLYLQVRALLNAFRSVVIERSPGAGADAEAAAGAAEAAVGRRRAACADLPLWTATAS
jgi:hypothetical protein